MRKAAMNAIADLVATDERVIFVGSDLGVGTLAEVREAFPDRVMMEGIAEQHMVGFAAGLALEGYIPYVHTIGTFLTRRALEQVIVDVALHDLPVRLIATGGGMVYAPLGPTHQSVEDFALMRAIPNMKVLAPADPLEMRNTLIELATLPGPAYVRVAKGGEADVTAPLPPAAIGRARTVFEGSEVALLTTGSLLPECMDAVEELRTLGHPVGLVHFPTIVPLDHDAVLNLIRQYRVLITVEEHLPTGGLGTAVAEVIASEVGGSLLVRLSLPARYGERYGSQRDHWEQEGLTGPAIARTALQYVEDSHPIEP